VIVELSVLRYVMSVWFTLLSVSILVIAAHLRLPMAYTSFTVLSDT